jgi:prepilin peptidase CpaA
MTAHLLISSSRMLFLAFLVLAAAWDFGSLRIPNLLTAGMALLFLAHGALVLGPGAWAAHLAAGAGVLAVALGLFAFGFVGGGDAKLLAVVALWAGPAELPALLVVMTLAGAALALLLLALRPQVWALAGILPCGGTLVRHLPRALEPGAGVPYGVPIACAGIATALA